MLHQEQVEALKEAKRRADRKFDRCMELLESTNLGRLKFDALFYVDRARAEAELLEHWTDKLTATLELAIRSAKREIDPKPGNA